MEKKKIKPIYLLELFKRKPKKEHIDEVIEIFEKLYDKYDSKVMLKAVLNNDGKSIEIYSTNFKTTLNKSKKAKNEVIEPVEENE